VEVGWRFLFWSSYLCKLCTSYNAPPTSQNIWRKVQEEPLSSLFMVGKAQKLHGAMSGLYGGCSSGVPAEQFSDPFPPYNSDLAPCDFWAFPTMKRDLRSSSLSLRQTFLRSGWSVVRSASLPKGGTSKKRQSPHLHKVAIWINKACPRSFQTAVLIYFRVSTHGSLLCSSVMCTRDICSVLTCIQN
jgi:hypothetical protein